LVAGKVRRLRGISQHWALRLPASLRLCAGDHLSCRKPDDLPKVCPIAKEWQ